MSTLVKAGSRLLIVTVLAIAPLALTVGCESLMDAGEDVGDAVGDGADAVGDAIEDVTD